MNNTTPCQPIGNDDGQYLGALTKKCSKCGEAKALEAFGNRAKSKDGLYPSCRACEAASSKKYYAENRDQVVEAVRKYEQQNREKVLGSKRRYYRKDPKGFTAKSTAYARAHKEQSNAHKQRWLENNPEKRKDASNKWYDENKEHAAAHHKAKYAKDPEKYLAVTKAWQARNKERVAQKAKAWRLANLDRSRATVRGRRLRTRRATWADNQSILDVYSEALRLTEETGVYHEVDHCYPIKGKTVSGLHVADNLRAIPHAMNRAKSSKLPGHLQHELWETSPVKVYYGEVQHA